MTESISKTTTTECFIKPGIPGQEDWFTKESPVINTVYLLEQY